MNNKTLTLNKKECNAVIEQAINSKRQMYYMCCELYLTTIEYLMDYKGKKPESLPADTLNVIIRNSFPGFRREYFKSFIKNHYPTLLNDVLKLEIIGCTSWLGCYPEAIKAKKAFLRTLIKE